ncbi:hypothetical protein [Mycolicibacterium komossense]|uniref:Uncharacterized protein n=1 Tax=Mycolicibacterium komossense TaxID=1779 RepID=A0ABT3CF18_9MYCO|nr:hypothetical protein [Mycolicibacterium komossense]MCV7228073.1 hypothetical protein [Mycolicibacterium komossense]
MVVLAGPGRQVPARIAGLLLPWDIEIIALSFTHPAQSDLWRVRMTVRAGSATSIALLTDRLQRLVDVLKVEQAAPVFSDEAAYVQSGK